MVLNGNQRRLAVGILFLAAINFEPAGKDQYLSLGLERLVLHPRDPGRHLELRRRIKHGKEALGHHVVNFPLEVVEFVGRFERRGDGEVVRDLRVVEHALGRFHPVFRQNPGGKRTQVTSAHVLQNLFHRVDIILGQGARIGSRIGEDLVMLVEPLRDLQRPLGRKTQASVRFLLQRGQIIEQRRKLRRGFLFFGNVTGFAVAFFFQRPRFRLGPEPLGLRVEILVVLGKILLEPAARIGARLGAKNGVDFPVALRHETLNFLVALDHDGERRRLHAAHRRELKTAVARIERRQRPRPVDPHQPVALRPADRRARQRFQFRAGPQVGETVADRRGRHRLEPEPPDRFLAGRQLHDVAENQFALAARVARIDQARHVRPLHQLFQQAQPPFAPFNRLQGKFFRDDRQAGKAPLPLFLIEFARQAKLDEVADGGRKDIGVALVIGLVTIGNLLKTTDGLGDITGDARFFCNDKSF